jgi:DNA-binding transcriptional LysR family regulator
MDWDDLRFVLKVAQTGSIAGAAGELGVNRTTVLRRINQFEKSLDHQIFDRLGSGYALAPGAEELLSAAIEVEKTIDDLHRQIQGKEVQLQGDLCVTTTDSLFCAVLAPQLAAFREQHPGIRMELVISNHRLSLTRRDADVAIRAGINPPENLESHRLSTLEFGIYGSPAYLERFAGATITEHQWLGLDPPILQAPPGQWVSRTIPAERICLSADSFLALRSAAREGLGLTLLPLPMVSDYPGLQRVFPDQPDIHNNLWLITHPDLARSARVHAFISHMMAAWHNC